jgi:uncharacterized protein (UPF0276 family)
MIPLAIKREQCPRPIPVRAGIGLRAQHHAQVIAEAPAVGWLEAHSENYFAAGGSQLHDLQRVRERYPLSLHGVGLSLGSVDPLDRQHLKHLGRLVRDFEPALVSEHLSWGSVDGRFANDLIPLPYTEEALEHIALRIAAVQDYLGRQILIENVSSYLRYQCSRLTEWDFLRGVIEASGCGLLLDVNNIYVAAQNHGFDAQEYIRALPAGCVREIHLAGHERVVVEDTDILIDTHSRPVCDAVWDLYEAALARFGAVATLIEWDSDIPALHVLVSEAQKADRLLERVHAVAA